MIFPVNLKVLSQMLDPAGQKCDLHIRAAGIFVMQLELREIRRLVALSHNEAPIVTEEAIFATAQRDERWSSHRHSHVAFWVASPLVRERGSVRVNFRQLTVGTVPSPHSSPLQQGARQTRRTTCFLSRMPFAFAVV